MSGRVSAADAGGRPLGLPGRITVTAVVALALLVGLTSGWGDWVFVGGIAVLVVAGALFLLLSRG